MKKKAKIGTLGALLVAVLSAGGYYINGNVYLSIDEGNGDDNYLFLTPLTTGNYQEQTIEF